MTNIHKSKPEAKIERDATRMTSIPHIIICEKDGLMAYIIPESRYSKDVKKREMIVRYVRNG